jgi:hypothetical protein
MPNKARSGTGGRGVSDNRTLRGAQVSSAKPGRNDLCPCGSGKKFKSCCAGKDRASKVDFSSWASKFHDKMPSLTDVERRESQHKYRRELGIIRDAERMACRIECILGVAPPEVDSRLALRALFIDVFDALYVVRGLITDGSLIGAGLLLRRALESTSLFAYLDLKPDKVDSWRAGKEIENSEIRKALESMGYAGDAAELRRIHKLECQLAHPNGRHLPKMPEGGESSFYLGSFCETSMDHREIDILLLLIQWSMFASMVLRKYGALVSALDGSVTRDIEQLIVELRKAGRSRADAVWRRHPELR